MENSDLVQKKIRLALLSLIPLSLTILSAFKTATSEFLLWTILYVSLKTFGLGMLIGQLIEGERILLRFWGASFGLSLTGLILYSLSNQNIALTSFFSLLFGVMFVHSGAAVQMWRYLPSKRLLRRRRSVL